MTVTGTWDTRGDLDEAAEIGRRIGKYDYSTVSRRITTMLL